MRYYLAGALALGAVTVLGCGDSASETGQEGTVSEVTSDLTARPNGPCDIFGAAGNKCAAAHSTVRALYKSYRGNLYELTRADGATKNIEVVAATGFANSAAEDTFCAGTSCVISTIYDQSSNRNDLTPGPPGGAKMSSDNPAPATDLKTTVDGHTVYGILIKPGIGYRKLLGTGTATGDEAETEYMVTGQADLIDGCCFDYGNAEKDAHDDGNGTAEAVYFGGGVVWGTGSPGGHANGPWVMTDLENGLYAGWQNGQDQDISTNTALKFDFVTAVVVGDTASRNAGKGRFALYGGAATAGSLKTEYDGIRPAKPGYVPMQKQGSIVLGIAGDNSDSSGGKWYEGVMASGAASLTTLNAVQANIVATKYGK